MLGSPAKPFGQNRLQFQPSDRARLSPGSVGYAFSTICHQRGRLPRPRQCHAQVHLKIAVGEGPEHIASLLLLPTRFLDSGQLNRAGLPQLGPFWPPSYTQQYLTIDFKILRLYDSSRLLSVTNASFRSHPCLDISHMAFYFLNPASDLVSATRLTFVEQL